MTREQSQAYLLQKNIRVVDENQLKASDEREGKYLYILDTTRLAFKIYDSRTAEKVDLFLVDHFKFNASADKFNDRYIICINRGVIDLMLDRAQEFYPDDQPYFIEGYKFKPEIIALMCTLNVAMHEFVHIMHGHFDYIKSLGFRRISQLDWLAMEYDADCMSAAALTRLSQHSNPVPGLLFHRVMVLTGIFWPLVLLPRSKSLTPVPIERHPSLPERLVYCLNKLATVDNLRSDGAGPISVAQFQQDINELIPYLRELETRYFEGMGKIIRIVDYIDESRRPSLRYMDHWQNIRATVLAHSP